MPAGRNISSIVFIGVENPDKARSSEFKKSEKVKKNWKIDFMIFLGFEARKTISLSFFKEI